jgi:hypothetical protein
MPSKSMKPKIIRVEFEEGRAGLFYATSPNLKGLLVAEDTREKCELAVPQAIRDLYSACGVSVVVTMAEDGNGDSSPFIAIPSELARQELARAS